MDPFVLAAAATAQRYFKTSQPLTRLGWGVSSEVYLSPDRTSAVKIHRHNSHFITELKAYRTLHAIRLTTLLGLTIPKLRGCSYGMQAIGMDCVEPPFLLDFAGVSFSAPDYSDEVMAEWHRGISDKFGPNASIAYAVYSALQRYGIWYTDLHLGNLNLEGHPDAVTPDSADADDSDML